MEKEEEIEKDCRTLIRQLKRKGMKDSVKWKWLTIIKKCMKRKISLKKVINCLKQKKDMIQNDLYQNNRKFELAYPPIHTAVICGDKDLFQIIAELYPRFHTLKIPDHEEHRTPDNYLLFLATESEGKNEIVKYIMSKISVPFECLRNLDDETPLHIAARNGNVELVKYFVESLKNANFQDRWGNTPIHSLLTHYPKSQNYQFVNLKAILECLILKTDLSLKSVHTSPKRRQKTHEYSALDLAIKMKLKDATEVIEVLAPKTIPMPKKTIQRCRKHFPKMEEGLQNIRLKQKQICEIEKKEGIQTDVMNLRGRVRERCVSLNLSFSELASNTSISDLSDPNESIKSEPPTIKYEPEGEEPPVKLSVHHDATNGVLFSKRSENNNLNTILGL